MFVLQKIGRRFYIYKNSKYLNLDTGLLQNHDKPWYNNNKETIIQMFWKLNLADWLKDGISDKWLSKPNENKNTKSQFYLNKFINKGFDRYQNNLSQYPSGFMIYADNLYFNGKTGLLSKTPYSCKTREEILEEFFTFEDSVIDFLSSSCELLTKEWFEKEKVMKSVKNVYIPHIIGNDKSVSVFADGENLVFAPDCPKMKEVLEALKVGDVEKLKELAKPAVVIDNYLRSSKANAKLGNDGAKIVDGVVLFNGQPMHNTLTDRILAAEAEGLPFTPCLRFLENLQENPSKNSVDELWDFLQHAGLPLTEDGMFLAFKRVRDDWMDFHSGTINYSVGNTITVPRNTVDDDKRKSCSHGIHCGDLGYVKSFNSGGHILVVKVNPKDVVSVPEEDSRKIRVCSLKCVGEYNGALPSDSFAKTGSYVDGYDSVNDWGDEDDYDSDDLLDDEDDDEICDECDEYFDECDCE